MFRSFFQRPRNNRLWTSTGARHAPHHGRPATASFYRVQQSFPWRLAKAPSAQPSAHQTMRLTVPPGPEPGLSDTDECERNREKPTVFYTIDSIYANRNISILYESFGCHGHILGGAQRHIMARAGAGSRLPAQGHGGWSHCREIFVYRPKEKADVVSGRCRPRSEKSKNHADGAPKQGSGFSRVSAARLAAQSRPSRSEPGSRQPTRPSRPMPQAPGP